MIYASDSSAGEKRKLIEGTAHQPHHLQVNRGFQQCFRDEGIFGSTGSGGVEGMGWRDGRVANGDKAGIQTLVVSNLAVTAGS